MITPAAAISHRFGLPLLIYVPPVLAASERVLQRAVHVVAVAGGSPVFNKGPPVKKGVAGGAPQGAGGMGRRDPDGVPAAGARPAGGPPAGDPRRGGVYN